MTNTVKLTEFINDNSNLRVLQGQECVAGKEITVSDVYRPGLELSGYFDFYPADRVQLLGRTEISYAARLDHDLRRKVFEKICQKETPCLLVSRQPAGAG